MGVLCQVECRERELGAVQSSAMRVRNKGESSREREGGSRARSGD